MKRLLLALAFVLLGALPSQAAIWDFVQSKSVDSGAGTSTTLAYNSNVVAGNLGVAVVRVSDPSPQNPQLTDSQGNTWTRHLIDVGTVDVTLALFSTVFGSSGADTLTLTNTSSVIRRWAIAEYDAAGQTITIDQTVIAHGSGTAPTSGSVTTTAASELLVGGIHGDGSAGDTFTAGTGYTTRETVFGGGVSFKVALEDRVVSSTGSYVADGTINNSMAWTAGVLTFKASGGAPACKPTLALLGVGRCG